MKEMLKEDIKYISQLTMMSKLENRTILITGATGMIPSYMINTILEYNDSYAIKPCKVFALCRSKDKAKEVFDKKVERKDIKFIYQDVCQLKELLGDIDYIVHAASNTNSTAYQIDPVGTYMANTIGTNAVLRMARVKKSTAMLFISSAAVYGEMGDLELRENECGLIDFTNYRNSYAESKRMGENMCLSYFQQFGVNIKIVRPFHIYGLGMRLDEKKFPAELISQIINNGNIILRSDGKAIRNFCYLRDAIIEIFAVMIAGKEGEIYNIGNPNESHSVNEFAKILLAIADAPDLKIEYNLQPNVNPSNGNNMQPSLKKIMNMDEMKQISFIGLEDGLKRTIIEIN